MTAAARPWIECYVWSDGTATQPVLAQRMKAVEAGTPDDVYLSGPLLFSAALDEWIASFTTALPSAYSWTWNRSTNRITISGGAVFSLSLHNDLAALLGFSSGSQLGAATYTGDMSPRGVAPLDGVEIDPVADVGELELNEYAHGRTRATWFANHDLIRARIWIAAADIAAVQSYCGVGRVRLHLTGSTAAQSSVALGGYVDGWIYGVRAIDSFGTSEQFKRVEMLIARAA